MPLVIFHHLLNVSVQLANKRGFNKTKKMFISNLLVLRQSCAVPRPFVMKRACGIAITVTQPLSTAGVIFR
jgi:hypothetical protein